MNVVVTWLLTAEPDPQRGAYLPSSVDAIADLRASVHAHRQHLVVLNDCLDEPDDELTTFVKVEPGGNPYFKRWTHTAAWLQTVDAGLIWCVDGTDVLMLHDPFPHMRPGFIYSGSEVGTLGASRGPTRWLRKTCPSRSHFYADHPDRPIVNMGLLGGSRSDVADAAALLAVSERDGDRWEMGAWQQIAFDQFGDRLRTGHPVHTEFGALDHTNPEAWWAHK